jgi:hypothetical protein
VRHTTGADVSRANKRSAGVAFVWVLTFLLWHVVWYATGLGFPDPSDRTGAARTIAYAAQAAILAMIVVGTVLPLALGMACGRRLPRRLLLTLGWIGFAVLAGRAVAGIADTALRLTGVEGGLTGLTEEQVMGTASPGLWDWIAGYTTDALFAAGAVCFGLATVQFQRATSRSQRFDVIPVRR